MRIIQPTFDKSLSTFKNVADHFCILLFVLAALFLIPELLLMMEVPLPPSTWLSRQFHTDRETNLFTWYSSVILFLVCVSALFNYFLTRDNTQHPSFFHRFGWIGVSLLALAMSADEIIEFHEAVGKVFVQMVQGRGGWIEWAGASGRRSTIPLFPLIAVAFTGFFAFLFKVMGKQRKYFVIVMCGLLLWINALIFEFFFQPTVRLLHIAGEGAFFVHMEHFVEEGSEIFGSLLVLIGFVKLAVNRLESVLQQSLR